MSNPQISPISQIGSMMMATKNWQRLILMFLLVGLLVVSCGGEETAVSTPPPSTNPLTCMTWF